MPGSSTVLMTDLASLGGYTNGHLSLANTSSSSLIANTPKGFEGFDSFDATANLKLNIKGSKSNMNIPMNVNSTYYGKDNSNSSLFFTKIVDILPSGGSTVSSGGSQDLVIFGDNEVMDFDSSKYTQKPVRSKLESRPVPLTFKEMKERAPKLFGTPHTALLHLFLQVEDMYARGLARCYNLLTYDEDDRYSDTMLLAPINVECFAKSSEYYLQLASEIYATFLKLKETMVQLNHKLALEYNANVIKLKWEIFTNASTIKAFENARPMLDALLRFKDIFDDIIHDTEYWVQIDEHATEMGHLVTEWNEETKKIEATVNVKGTSNDTIPIQVLDLQVEQHLKLCSTIFCINTACTSSSDFANQCGFFLRQLEELKRGYSEFVATFRAAYTEDGVFQYEICLLDDHMRLLVAE